MTADEIFKDKAFDCLEPERKEAFAKLYVALQGKSPEQAVPLIMNFMRAMPQGHKITAAERDAMLTAVTANMSPKEKRNGELIFKRIM